MISLYAAFPPAVSLDVCLSTVSSDVHVKVSLLFCTYRKVLASILVFRRVCCACVFRMYIISLPCSLRLRNDLLNDDDS